MHKYGFACLSLDYGGPNRKKREDSSSWKIWRADWRWTEFYGFTVIIIIIMQPPQFSLLFSCGTSSVFTTWSLQCLRTLTTASMMDDCKPTHLARSDALIMHKSWRIWFKVKTCWNFPITINNWESLKYKVQVKVCKFFNFCKMVASLSVWAL